MQMRGFAVQEAWYHFFEIVDFRKPSNPFQGFFDSVETAGYVQVPFAEDVVCAVCNSFRIEGEVHQVGQLTV